VRDPATRVISHWVAARATPIASPRGAQAASALASPRPGAGELIYCDAVRPEDVYELTWVSDPRSSPDGRTLAYVVSTVDREENTYRSAIWLAATDGSSPPRRFTAGKKQDAAPRWSPDGGRLAFLSSRDRNEKQLYVIPATGGEALRLTDLDEDVSGPVWSPDGTRLAFSSRVRDPAYDEDDERKRPPRRFTRLQYKLDDVGWTGDRRRHVFTVAADGSAPPAQLTDGDFEDENPAWSPDGTRIAFDSARHESWDVELVHDLYVVEADGGEPRRLTSGDAWYEAPAWSPDGSELACRFGPGGFDFPRHGRIALVDAATGERRLLTGDLDLNCSPFPEVREPVWDGEDVLFVLEDAGNNHLYRVPATGGSPALVVGGEVWITGFDCVGGATVYAATTPTCPAELYRGGQRLTEVTRSFCERRELAEPERFTATSADGTEVEAWLMRPQGFEPGCSYPVLLSIHGGPFTQYGNRFFDEFQVYTGAGYAVLYSNPRGSSGYSEEWGRAIRGPVEGGPGWGTLDYEDLIGVVDETLRRFDFLDPERLGVLGGSYGGFMTSWIVGHTDRFRAACSERSVNNFVLEGGSSDLGALFKAYVGAHWFEAPEAYWQISPSRYATNIQTPLLILHSENDLRCPIGNAEDLFAILRVLGREVELVRFPGESHELTRSGSPVHRVQRFEVILEFFERHLSPGERRELGAASKAGVLG
jgi:dipeptidyl aminopeptidase/acylaminoacyl peptidase